MVAPPPLARRLSYGLPGEVWAVQVGILVNMLGYGAVLPFELVYLHQARGMALGTAGLVVATLTGLAVVAAPVSGPLIDRWGARAVAVVAGVGVAVGYAGLAFATTSAQAFVAAGAAGLGNGALNPAQTTLLTTLTPADRRHRTTGVSRVAVNLGIGLGGVIGGWAAVHGLAGFMALFLANAATTLAYVVMLVLLVRRDVPHANRLGGYGLVLRDGVFRRLLVLNIAVIGVGWGVFPWLVPTYVIDTLALPPGAIGVLFLSNALAVVVFQLPIVRFAQGRRRGGFICAACLTFALALTLVLSAQTVTDTTAAVLLVAAAVGFGIGECLYSAVLTPLVADLAPESVRGRYLAAVGLSWWLGLAAAPALGAQLLDTSPGATFGGAALIALAAAGLGLDLNRRLPSHARRTPTPDGQPSRT